MHRYAPGVSAVAGGGHRVALGDATSEGRPARVLDERTGKQIAAVPQPRAGCRPSALGAALLAFDCGSEPVLYSLSGGGPRLVALDWRPIADEATVEAIGSRWLWVHVTPYHVDADVLVGRTGRTRPVKGRVDGGRPDVDLPPGRVVDLDAPSGTRRLCAPIRRRTYRSPGISFHADDRGAVWSTGRGVWLQHCGHRPIRLARGWADAWIATRRTVAWIEGFTAVAVDRRTLRRRTWHVPVGNLGPTLALTHDRLWVNTLDRRQRPIVLTGRVPR